MAFSPRARAAMRIVVTHPQVPFAHGGAEVLAEPGFAVACDDRLSALAPDEAALLTFLARLVGARCALEVGTFTGYGAISIARGLADGGRLTLGEVTGTIHPSRRR